MIFGKLIVEHRNNFLFDLARDQSKVDNFSSDLLVGIIFRISDLYVLRRAELKAGHRIVELRQRLSRTDFQRIILPLTAGKRLASDRAVKVQGHKIPLLHDVAVAYELQPRVTFLESLQRFFHLRIGNRKFHLLHFDAEIVANGNLRFDLKNRGKRKCAALAEVVGFDLGTRHDLQSAFPDNLSQRFFHQVRSNFAFHFVAVDALQHAARNLARAKSFNPNASAEILVGARKLARDGFRRKFHANFSLHGIQFIDVNFHGSVLCSAGARSLVRMRRVSSSPTTALTA